MRTGPSHALTLEPRFPRRRRWGAWALALTTALPASALGQQACRENEHRGGYPPGCVCNEGFQSTGRGNERVCTPLAPPTETPPEATCLPTQHLSAGHCCEGDQQWLDGACRVWCPAELREENGRCVSRCPPGLEWNGGGCQGRQTPVPSPPYPVVPAPPIRFFPPTGQYYAPPVQYPPQYGPYPSTSGPSPQGLMHGVTLGLSAGGIIFDRALAPDASHAGLMGSVRLGYALGSAPQFGVFAEGGLFNQLRDNSSAVTDPATAPRSPSRSISAAISGTFLTGGLQLRIGGLNEYADAKSWRVYLQLEAEAGRIAYSTELASGLVVGVGGTISFGPRNSWTAAGLRVVWMHDVANGLDAVVIGGDGHFDFSRRW